MYQTTYYYPDKSIICEHTYVVFGDIPFQSFYGQIKKQYHKNILGKASGLSAWNVRNIANNRHLCTN